MRLLVLFIAFLNVWFAGRAAGESVNGRFQDYRNHSCVRDCSAPDQTRPMVCVYEFTLETYSAMSRACFSCPRKRSDCEREQCIAADGFQRGIQVVNRLLPGPSIQVCKGDTVVVSVENELRSGEVTSIHWHGFRMPNNNYMDGVPLVTQYPIGPFDKFTYTFQATDAGTFSWHSHSAAQYADGIFGSLIVRQSRRLETNAGLYDYDLPEHVITVNDWAHIIASEWASQYLHADGVFGLVKGLLINGMGVSEYGNSNRSTPMARFYVKRGARYRFRLIDHGTYSSTVKFSIDNHNLTVIATDGNPIEPVEVESVVINPGERYDFVVNARMKTGKYFIKVINSDNQFQLAELIYEGAVGELDVNSVSFESANRPGKSLRTASDAKSSDQDITVLDLKNRDHLDAYKGKPDKKFYMNIDMSYIDNPEFQQEDLFPISQVSKENSKFMYETSTINSIQFMMPTETLLSKESTEIKKMFCNETTRVNFCKPDREFCSCLQLYELELDDLVEIIIADKINFYSHPMHLHGHNFAIIGSETLGKVVEMDVLKELDKNGSLARNFDRPVIKDTLAVPFKGYSIIRFRADNPGYWMFHCHLLFHGDHGMAMVFKVGQESDFPEEPPGWEKRPKSTPSISSSIAASKKQMAILLLIVNIVLNHIKRELTLV